MRGALQQVDVVSPPLSRQSRWLPETGRATTFYTLSQGTAIGHAGRVHVERDTDGTTWVGGATPTCVSGEVEL